MFSTTSNTSITKRSKLLIVFQLFVQTSFYSLQSHAGEDEDDDDDDHNDNDDDEDANDDDEVSVDLSFFIGRSIRL